MTESSVSDKKIQGREGHRHDVSRHVTTRRLEWIWIPVAIFGIARLVTTLILLASGHAQIPTEAGDPRDVTHDYFMYKSHPADPGILAVSTNWDGQWYQLIAEQGYSSSNDPVSARARDFPPVYPYAVRALMSTTGLDFAPAAVGLSLAFGALAMVLLYRLILHYRSPAAAAGGVALTSCFMTAPVFQLAYSESLALALLLVILLLLRSGRPWWALAPLLLLSLTRMITPPLAIVAVAVAWDRRRRGLTTSRTSLLGYAAFAGLAPASVFVWSWAVTQMAGGGEDRVRRMASDLEGGWVGILFPISWPMGLLTVAILVMFVRIAWSERNRWGVEMSAWAAGYSAFIWLTTPPITGFLRYMLLAFPFALGVAAGDFRSRRSHLMAVAMSCVGLLVLQYIWVRYFFIVEPDRLPLIP